MRYLRIIFTLLEIISLTVALVIILNFKIISAGVSSPIHE